MRIAVIGTGIAGNVVARALHREHDLTVFEAGDHIGGHTHTHRLERDDGVWHVDTGFIVFNDRTYPRFLALLDELEVASQPSTMSFSVRDDAIGLEYCGSTLDALFCQRRNLLRPAFHRMVLEILRFNREAPRLLDGPAAAELRLGDYLAEHRYGRNFIDHYLVPMGSAIWSTDPARMMGFPARFFVRFLHNHGMLTINDRPQWRTIRGGSARYVDKLVAPFVDRIRLNTPVSRITRTAAGVLVRAGGDDYRFDHVFLACHSDQALAMISDPTPLEREVLGAIGYQPNEVVLHTDTSVLPRNRRAWAAWNSHVDASPGAPVALTYDMNTLQSLGARERFCVTLNRSAAIDPAKVIARMQYAHPLFTPEAVAAQARHGELDGVDRLWFCGAWWGQGFHEDGVASAHAVLDHFRRGSHGQRHLSRVA